MTPLLFILALHAHQEPPSAYSSLALPAKESFAVDEKNSPAMRFIPKVSGQLAAIRVAMHNAGTEGTGGFTLTLQTENSKGLPGTVLGVYEGRSNGTNYSGVWPLMVDAITKPAKITKGTPLWLTAKSEKDSLSWVCGNAPASKCLVLGKVENLVPAAFDVLVTPP